MFYKAVLLFVLIQPWVQVLDVNPSPDATLLTQKTNAKVACCVEPWPCFPGEVCH